MPSKPKGRPRTHSGSSAGLRVAGGGDASGSVGDVSSVELTDAEMAHMVGGGVSSARHTESEGEGTAVDEAGPSGSVKVSAERKRVKTLSPRAGVVGGEFVHPDSPKRRKRKKPKPRPEGQASDSAEAGFVPAAAVPVVGRSGAGVGGVAGDSAVVRLKEVTSSLMAVVFDAKVEHGVARQIVDHVGRYEVMLMSLVAENERLKGRLEVFGTRGVGAQSAALPAVPAMAPPVAAPACVPAPVPAQKPVETWSVVVRSKQPSTSKEVIERVVREVGPTLGVRVHEVRPARGGGAVIRTPSVAERERMAANSKFAEVGLEVSVGEKRGTGVVVSRVNSEFTPDEFMGDLYELNLKDRMTPEAFKKGVRIVSRPWKVGAGGSVDIVLEGDGSAMQSLLDVGRCYVKWFSFRVRALDPVSSCFRCLGFDHRVSDCRLKENVCRRCGQLGHWANKCSNALNCRNCAFKGLPSGHHMMSAVCPVYSAIVARAKARH